MVARRDQCAGDRHRARLMAPLSGQVTRTAGDSMLRPRLALIATDYRR